MRRTSPASGAVRVITKVAGAPPGAGDHTCDICKMDFTAAKPLRDHIATTHHRFKGTLINCWHCNFSCLNKRHLDKHKQICKVIELKKERQNKIAARKSRQVAGRSQGNSDSWCRFQGACRRANCTFKHEAPRPSSGVNPASVDQQTYDQSFPFLANSRRPTVIRSGGK